MENGDTSLFPIVTFVSFFGNGDVSPFFSIYYGDVSPFFSIFLIQDITERKKAEEQIQQSLREKETLLRELYHRTKNNMQVITSLLDLQSRGIDNKKTLQMLEDTKDRIHSMALVHEKLYKSKNLSQVYLSDYIKDLADALMESHNVDKEEGN